MTVNLVIYTTAIWTATPVKKVYKNSGDSVKELHIKDQMQKQHKK